MRIWGVRIACLVATSMLVFGAACGGDDDDDSGDDDAQQPAAAATSPGSSPEPDDDGDGDAQGGGDSGTFTVDGNSYEFEVIFCGFTPEETRNDNVPFSLRATGSDNGRDYSIDGAIIETDVAGIQNTSHSLSMWYDDDELNPIYDSGVPGAAPSEWTINGNSVSFEGSFENQAGDPVGVGTLEGTCP